MKKSLLINSLIYLSLFSGLNCTLFKHKIKDADKDGVADKRDKCANTPNGALVDKTGCIIDADKDGIADNLDACPAVAGLAKFSGCPDTDNDGVEDRVDRCVNVAGSVKLEGCPDTDGDGIEDYKDKCPGKAGVAAFSGCPDTDGDGVEDAIDQCPSIPGPSKFEGCPDSDGDGIQENLDKCPTLPGTAINNGCPEIKAEVKKLLTHASQGIAFENGKAAIKKTSDPLMEKLIKIMKDNPDYRLHLIVFSENKPDHEKGLLMAKERAKAIEKILVANGVEAVKIFAEGHPSSEGVNNRKRIELNIQFQNFLR